MTEQKRIIHTIDLSPKLSLNEQSITVKSCNLSCRFNHDYESGYRYEWEAIIHYDKETVIRLSDLGVLSLGAVTFAVELVGFQLLSENSVALSLKPLQFPHETIMNVYEA